MRNLRDDHRSQAAHAIEAAWRASHAGCSAIPGTMFEVYKTVEEVRHELAMGNPQRAMEKLETAAGLVCNATPVGIRKLPPVYARYDGATVVNAQGVIIGEMQGTENGQIVLELGGVHDFWGFLDISTMRQLVIPPDSLIFGPTQLLGESIVVLPTRRIPPFE